MHITSTSDPRWLLLIAAPTAIVAILFFLTRDENNYPDYDN